MKLFAFIAAIAALIVGFSACERMSQVIQPTTPEVEDQATRSPSESLCP